jgi:hypothetical protein
MSYLNIMLSPHSELNQESFGSRADDIRRDSSNIYVLLFECIENAYEWGKASEVSIIARENKILIKDNGANGFGSLEGLFRFFKLGKRNKDFSENTIGKYGKGGYKACITLGTEVVILTTIDNKSYKITANFTTMIDTNTWDPSQLETLSSTDEPGTTIILTTRPLYDGKIDPSLLERYINRTYYKKFSSKKISLDILGTRKVIDIGNVMPVQMEDIRKTRKYYVIYKAEDATYYKKQNDKTDYNETVVGEIYTYVLRRLVSKFPLLSNEPGLDIFRNERCLTITGPINNMYSRLNSSRNIKNLLTKGQMRGNACYVKFAYNDKQIRAGDNGYVDDDMAASTQKEFTCSDKMNDSLLELILVCCEETNKDYENAVEEDKKDILQWVTKQHDIGKNEPHNMIHLKQLLHRTEKLHESLEHFKKHKKYRRDGDDYEFICTSTEISDCMVNARTNSKVYKVLTCKELKSKRLKTINTTKQYIIDKYFHQFKILLRKYLVKWRSPAPAPAPAPAPDRLELSKIVTEKIIEEWLKTQGEFITDMGPINIMLKTIEQSK